MSGRTISWLLRRKWILAGIGLLLLVIGWWVFHPEKLWVNQKVSEVAPPGVSADSQPLYTGLLAARAHPTSGRASIYQAPGGKRELRLTDFSTSNGPNVHVVLAQSADAKLKQNFVKGELDSVELGSLKANQGDQNYELPDSADLGRYDTVVIYCERFHVLFGVAKLDKF
jgi:Electron transfer DM13